MAIDTDLLFGVKGGSAIHKGSGKAILEDLQKIVSKIENTGATQLKFSADTASIRKMANSVASELKKIMKSVSETTVKAPDTNLSQLNTYVSKVKSAYKDLEELQKKSEPKQISAVEEQKNEINKTAQEFVKQNRPQSNLTSQTDKHLTAAISTFAVNVLRNSLQQMYQNVIEIDTAMTQLRQVTNETDTAYNHFLINACDKAEKLGVTVSDTVTAAAGFARLGYSLSDSAQLAEASLVYKNIENGITDVSEASSNIVSAMQAFGLEAGEAMRIVDKFNAVGGQYAVASSGIGDVLKNSAASLAAAGNSLDESISLAAAVNAVVQDPQKAGDALNTIVLYLRAAKTEAQNAGIETEGMANSVTELRNNILLLTGDKVDIMSSDTDYKSTFQILKEISSVWDNIAAVDQSELLRLLSGQGQAGVTQNLLQNFSNAESAMTAAGNSSGSALAENEKHLDSINGKISQFQTAFQKLSESAVNDGAIKFFIDLGTAIMDVGNFMAQTNALIPVAVAGFLSLKKNIGEPIRRNAPAYAPLQNCA